MRILRAFVAAVIIAGSATSCTKRGEPEVTADKTKLAQPQSAAARERSEPHWPKQALNRANDVKRQVAEQRKGEKAVVAGDADQP
jgi:hypothetical protein